jgi:MFS transporter, ACDE family, multidrug resistance protein
MPQISAPELLRFASVPGAKQLALLASLDAVARAVLLSVFPVLLYRALENAEAVSSVYFLIGFVALVGGLLTPWLTRLATRRWVFTFGTSLYLASAGLGFLENQASLVLALLCYSLAAVIVFVCLNAYILDFIVRAELGRVETLRMFYSALAWSIGPAIGVWLMKWWPPAPFILSGVAALILLSTFWWMRLGNGKFIKRSGQPAPNSFRYLRRFLRQRRLVAGWLFAVLKSAAWWVYIIYLPIYAVKNGLGEELGGIALSLSNGLLFATPLMLRWMQRHSVRRAVRTGFMASALAFAIAAGLADHPSLAVASLFLGSIFLILLDISAGLPFLMAVKPSERIEMSAIYSNYSNLSAIVTPGIAWLVLIAAPLPGIFAAAAIWLILAWAVADGVHPRLGRPRATIIVKKT